VAFFQETEHYEVEISDGGETATVTLRPLTAGDLAAIYDSSTVSAVSTMSGVGTLKLVMCQRAIVSWTLEGNPTMAKLRALKPKVLDAIFEAIKSDGTEDPTGADS
jgi:hypothetical protein